MMRTSLHLAPFAARVGRPVGFVALISGVAMVLAAYLLGFDGKRCQDLLLGPGFATKAPNSAHTEGLCAGALDIQLAGDAYYFGALHHSSPSVTRCARWRRRTSLAPGG